MEVIKTTTHRQKKSKTIELKRSFSNKNRSPFTEATFKKVNSKISNSSGETVFEMQNIEVPESWSQLAIDILASKYLKRAGVPKTGAEVSIKQVLTRITHTLRVFGENNGYFNVESGEIFEDELTYLLLNQVGAFNSPVWFNLGLWHAYQIKGSGGNFAWDLENEEAKQLKDSYSRPQCSACFIQSVDDDLMSVFELAQKEAKLFKYGSGSGTNFSKIRGRKEKLSGGGTSSGLMSFLDVLDRGAGATKSGGITRRAAKMVCLDVDHPEITDFIKWKQREELKAHALIKGGFSDGFEGEAYRTVSGQNSNNSVRVSDKFMDALAKNEDWNTYERTTGEIADTYKATEIWEMIAEAAWNCADPGLQFDTTINEWHTCPNSDKINASNPCSEFMFLDNTACNLASLNLVHFLNKDGSFDIEKFKYACRIFITAQDILVDLSSYPTAEIAKNSHDYRPLGLGYANLGTLLMLKGIAYDSDEGRALASGITSLMTAEAYACSAELAEKKGAFKGYKPNENPMLKVIKKHKDETLNISSLCPIEIKQAAQGTWSTALNLGKKHGFRNAQVSVLAPTGTIGLLMDCDTTGVEPEFSLVKYKKLSGDGYVKISNRSVEPALKQLGYLESEIKEMLDHLLENFNLEKAPHLKPEHLSIFDCANKCGESGTRYIEPLGHLKMMAAVQPFLSGAISKTVNLPKEVTQKQIQEIFTEAWKLKLKAITVYRDGSKQGQPLVSEDSSKSKPKEEASPQRKSRDVLPPRRTGFTQEASIGGHKIHLRTGEYKDGRIGEIFIDMHKEGASYRSIMNCFAIAISLALQYGVPLEEFVKKFTFTRFDPSGFVEGHPNVKFSTSVVDYIFRVLAMEYLGRTDLVQVKPELNNTSQPTTQIRENISQQEHLAEMMGDAPPCDQCGHTSVRNGSCYRCLNCGNSMGCS